MLLLPGFGFSYSLTFNYSCHRLKHAVRVMTHLKYAYERRLATVAIPEPICLIRFAVKGTLLLHGFAKLGLRLLAIEHYFICESSLSVCCFLVWDGKSLMISVKYR